MRLLLFPSDCGGGFGHISRCLALADEARQRGHSCIFVLNDTKYLRPVHSRFPVRLCRERRPLAAIGRWLRHFRRTPARPLFSEFSGLDYQVPRDGLLSTELAQRRLEHYLRAVDEERPDLLVGDTNMLVHLLAARTGLPSVQLVRYASHPDTARLIWWKEVPAELVPPRTPDLFNPLLERLNLPPISRAEELLRGDLYLVPSLPEIEPVPQAGHTVHLGSLVNSRDGERVPRWFAGLPEDRPLVYATVGGGAGLVGSTELTRRLIDACAGLPVQLVLATGGTVRRQDLPALPDNVRLLSWAPGRQLIARARLVIFHGGYGTMMETLSAGRPAMVIPFQTEQEGNGRRLEQLGCALLMKPSQGEPTTITAHWAYGRYTWRAQTSCDLTAGELSGGISRLLEDDSFTRKAVDLQQKIVHRRGAELAVDRLEQLLKK